MLITRYSRTRVVGANHTACTKLSAEDKQALHWIALERGVSDYELTRQVLLDFIYGPDRPTKAVMDAERESAYICIPPEKLQ